MHSFFVGVGPYTEVNLTSCLVIATILQCTPTKFADIAGNMYFI